MLDVTNSNLPSPREIKEKYPLENIKFVEESRNIAKKIFLKKDNRICLVVGPCSIHNDSEAIDYAKGLKELNTSCFFPIMRVYCEKPRTTLGWKGLLYDPHLDGSYNFIEGIIRTRKLLLTLINLNVPCATEFLDPLIAPYIDDLIIWGFIGARTTASQPHRLLSSGFSFPIGFKNAVDGNIEVAIQGAYVANQPHAYPGINQKGTISRIQSKGNPFSHIVLRGANTFINYDQKSIQKVLSLLDKYQVTKRIIIDCAHGNSHKCDQEQKAVFKDIFTKIILGNASIMGIMLESNLKKGSQPLSKNLQYGISITDPCISFSETKELILWAENLIEEKCLAL